VAALEMSCGPTPELASQSLKEAVEIYLIAAGETGTLAEVLEEAGYQPEGEGWHSPTWVALEKAGITRDEYFGLLEQVR
jgi:hypothetical protein